MKKNLKYSTIFRINPDTEPPFGMCIEMGLDSVKDIVGTFKNGTLEGDAKISFFNGTKTIANFKNGLYFGLRRDWSSNGKLNHVAYYNQYIMSPAWNQYRNFLIFSDVRKIKLTDDKKYEMDFVFDMKTSKAYIGSLINPIQEQKVLVDIYEVELTNDLDDTICLPRPKWTMKSKADYILLLQNDQKISLRQQETCSNLFGNSIDVESVYHSWVKSRVTPDVEMGLINLFKNK